MCYWVKIWKWVNPQVLNFPKTVVTGEKGSGAFSLTKEPTDGRHIGEIQLLASRELRCSAHQQALFIQLAYVL